MDLWQLKIFCQVIDRKSFSLAGRALNLSQPTVSSHIKDLETHFNCRLIDRLKREALATRAGERLYQYARRLLDLQNETESAMAAFLGEIKGNLTVGGSTIPGEHILPQLMAQFIARYPAVDMVLTIADTQEIVSEIVDGKIEIGIVGAPAAEPDIFQQKLIQDRLCLVVPANHDLANQPSVHIRQVAQQPFIIREQGSGTLKSIINSMQQAGFDAQQLNITACMGSTGSIIAGIKHGLGVSILSALAVTEETRNGMLKAIPLEGMDATRWFYLTCHRQRTPSPLCQRFREFLETEPTGI